MNFRHVQLIIKREYLSRLRSPGFAIGTTVGVLGIIALAFMPALLNLLDQQTTLKIAIVDPRQIIYPYLPQNTALPPEQAAASASTQPASLLTGILFMKPNTTDENVLSSRVEKGELSGFVVVEGSAPSNASFVYHGKSRLDPTTSARLLSLLTVASTQARLREAGISSAQAQALFAVPNFTVQPIANGVLKDTKAAVTSAALVYVLLILLYTTMLMYGIQVAMGVVEEKSSRVMEILITSVRPIELMIGKVLGVGLVGLTQYSIWVAAGLVVLVVGGAAGKSLTDAGIDVSSVPAGTLIFFLVFFVLGYLLFASVYAALGSLVNRSEDVNNVTSPVTIIMVAVYLLSLASLGSPDADFVKWLSFVPFFSPMLMFLRVALGTPAWWELALSIGLLLATSLLLAWLAAKIYRVGVLLYGKRPSFREIGRLLRTA